MNRIRHFVQEPPPFFAKLMVVLAAMIWGSAFLVMKNTLDGMGPFTILAVRFTVAAVLLGLLCAPQWRRDFTPVLLTEGGVMGTLLFGAFALQTVGLMGTTPGKNAFLTALYCVEVPFLCWLLRRGRPDRYDVIGSVLCLVGVGLVSLRGSWQISWGDQLTILCSVLFAGHIVAASIFTKRHNAMLLTVLQFAFAAVWAWGCALGTKEVMAWPSVNQIASLLYLAVFSTSIGLSLQNYGEKHLPAPTLSILLSLESVFGVLFSVTFGMESLTVSMTAGFAVIFVAVIVAQVKPAWGFWRKKT